MSSAYSIVQAYLAYYSKTRGVGHTTVARIAADSATHEPLFICANEDSVRGLKRAIRYDNTSQLTGLNRPLVWDNHALTSLFERVSKEIEMLRAKWEELYLDSFLGLLYQEAIYRGAHEGFTIRIVEEDGRPHPITTNVKTDRINITLKHGKVVEATIG